MDAHSTGMILNAISVSLSRPLDLQIQTFRIECMLQGYVAWNVLAGAQAHKAPESG
jgi:hypothetical protein